VFDGLFEIPTLQEVIDLAQARGVGIYPETKHPSYFDSIGLSLEEPLLAVLAENGYEGEKAAVFIQSFEVGNLKSSAPAPTFGSCSCCPMRAPRMT
jgi:glycerophosphoryl diester phosphodiesterase